MSYDVLQMFNSAIMQDHTLKRLVIVSKLNIYVQEYKQMYMKLLLERNAITMVHLQQ